MRYRFSGHETFPCRYAWLPKAYRELRSDPSAFADEEEAMIRLGVGKNMVRSIRFWMVETSIAEKSDGRSYAPTAFGARRPNLLPVLVTGSRDALSERLLLAVAAAVDGAGRRGKPPAIVGKLRGLLDEPAEGGSSDSRAVELLTEAARYVRESGRGDGLLIILDELGKFLEFAALHPNRQDVHFLQSLAEAAARSGETPIFVVALLHQGFHAYAEQLTLSMQREPA